MLSILSLKKTERARGIPHFLYEYLVFTIVSEVASLDGHVVGRYPGIFGGDCLVFSGTKLL